MSEKSSEKIASAKVVPWSSIVGTGVTLHAADGRVVGQLALMNVGAVTADTIDEIKRRHIALAQRVAAAINASSGLDP